MFCFFKSMFCNSPEEDLVGPLCCLNYRIHPDNTVNNNASIGYVRIFNYPVLFAELQILKTLYTLKESQKQTQTKKGKDRQSQKKKKIQLKNKQKETNKKTDTVRQRKNSKKQKNKYTHSHKQRRKTETVDKRRQRQTLS